ncbi:MAG: DNA polymerase IV, partial [Tissierellales bacterium]
WEYANGIENSQVKINSDPLKSIGNSTTTSYDVDNRREAHMFLLALSEMVAMRTRNLGKVGRVISISIKDENFYSCSHQKKLDVATNSTKVIYQTAKKLFDEIWDGKPIRRFAVSISELYSNNFFQLSLLNNYNQKEEQLEKTIDEIRHKYGCNSIVRSCFLHSGINPIIGGVTMEEEYPMMSSII